MKLPVILLAILPSVSLAQQAAETVRIADIISAVGPSWDSSANFKAVLIRNEGEADLYIYSDPFSPVPTVFVAAIAPSASMWGAEPWLEFNEAGALIVMSENRAFGRIKWDAALTIARANGAYFVTGYNFSAYDSLDLDYFENCDIDFEASTVVKNGEVLPVDMLLKPIVLTEWNENYPVACT